MLETPHVALGVAIATKIPNPFIAIPLAFASHFVLDKVPHWNPHTYTETARDGMPSRNTFVIAAVDAFISLGLGLGFAYYALPNGTLALTIIACSFASVLPDVSKYPFFLLKKLRHGIYKKWVDYERTMQVQVNSVGLGLATQILTILACFWWIKG